MGVLDSDWELRRSLAFMITKLIVGNLFPALEGSCLTFAQGPS